MKLVHHVVLAAALLNAGAGFAQDSLTGTWRGQFESQSRRGSTFNGVTMVIHEVKDGDVTGTLTYLSRGTCSGDFELKGRFGDGTLSMRSAEKGGRTGECSFRFEARLQDGKLVGKTSQGRAVELGR